MVLTYNYDEDRPGKDWVLKTDHGLDGDSLSYLDMMEHKSQDEQRRARERQLMDEGRLLSQTKRSEEMELAARDREEVKEMSRVKMFGRPGNGAPTGDVRKKKFTEHQLDIGLKRSQSMFGLDSDYPGLEGGGVAAPRWSDDQNLTDASMEFGRPGNGAPSIRGNAVRGNPEIRFQANEGVQKSIYDHIRYAAPPQEKSQYHAELEEQVRQRQEMTQQQAISDLNITQQLEAGGEVPGGGTWGKPGPGGAYWRSSALTGQGFFAKMGWADSADPRKRQFTIKQGENEEMKREISEIEAKRVEAHHDMTDDQGLELAPLMKNQTTGRPRKDPTTGYMMDHSLNSTDITKHASQRGPQPWHSAENKQQYWEQLTGQVSEKREGGQRSRDIDRQQQTQHFKSWETYWGRPGYGAPRDSVQKENLMKMLHYPANTVKNAPNSVELLSLERLPVKH